MSKYDNWTLAKLKAEKHKLVKKYNDYHEISRAINDMTNEYDLWNVDGADNYTFTFASPTMSTYTDITST